MDCWNRILGYYMRNERCFSSNAYLMADVYCYCGDVVTPDGVKYYFEAPFWGDVCRRERDECGFEMLLPEDKIQQYFITDYEEKQRFAILFGHWYGLAPKQISYLADRRKSLRSWNYLNYFICNRNKESVGLSSGELCKYIYEGNYCLTNSNSAVRQAVYKNGYLVDAKENFQYRYADKFAR